MDSNFQFRSGHRLDDFQIEAPLCKGAMAEVYRAADLLTRQSVAIKVPSSDVINHPLVFYHYQNEMRILSRIHHPNVVRAIERERSLAYSIFEYIPGITLRRHLRGRKWMRLGQALDYADQVARGLGYLHDCGIIHLDIKPENILITPAGRIKIIDFGLARQLGAPDLLFEDFVRPHGTPDYISPEQLVHHRDDPRADQYSLALVLYEMLTGRLPFERNQRLSFVRRRMKTAPVTPRRFREAIPAALAEIILKALSVDPMARYSSVTAFADALATAESSADFADISSIPDPASTTEGGDEDASAPQCALPVFSAMQPGILAAIADDDQAAAVAHKALHLAMADSRPVTLLTVVTSDATDDWIRYGDEARGQRLSRILEQLALKFRHFGIDPSVRIRSGKPAKVIIETARAIDAGMIVVGASPMRFFKRFLGGGTIRRIMKRTDCLVMVAGSIELPQFPEDRSPTALTEEEVLQADTFLTTLWIGQINWLATLVHGVLVPSHTPGEVSFDEGPVGSWLQQMLRHAQWAPVVQSVQFVYNQLHTAVGEMKTAARRQDRNQLCGIYLQKSLPLACRLREELQAVSTKLRRRAGLAQGRQVGLLRRPVCPLEEKSPLGSGPIQQLQTLKTYLCSQDPSPGDSCAMEADDVKCGLPERRN